MKLYLIDPYDGRFYKNNLFNQKLFPNLTVWIKIKKLLLTKKIILDTIDLHSVKDADKIFFFDHNNFSLSNNDLRPYLKICLKNNISKEKLNLVIIECPIIKPSNWIKKNHNYYEKIFTWNDALIDNKKYFHYLWLQNTKFYLNKEVPFNNKKFITLINARKTNYSSNELYSLRNYAIQFFEKNYPNDFDLYGVGWNKPLSLKFIFSALKGNFIKIPIFIKDYLDSFISHSSYRGEIEDKITILSQYKYCLCFENMKNIDGYITEKIFDCFKAKTIPIYFGAQNILKYIPKQSFIDYRDFNNFGKLSNYLSNISEKNYQNKIDSINLFLKSDFRKWDYQHFTKNIFFK